MPIVMNKALEKLRTRIGASNAFFGFTAVFSLSLDQWTKFLARAYLRPLGPGKAKVVISNCLDVRFSENAGAAFGAFRRLWGSRFWLPAVGLTFAILLWRYLLRSGGRQIQRQFAFGLMVGGALGNAMDRIVCGRVTDFIVLKMGEHAWPAFNIADTSLVLGVVLMAFERLMNRPKPVPADQDGKPPSR
jgi:signal peptidase II